jgi:NTP pyrophosphatase (non-canonical NTP hydrolase)
MNINDTAKAIYTINVEKGFWENPRNKGELLMLVVSELAEALEADRKNRYSLNNPKDIAALANDEDFNDAFSSHVKDTFEDEIADAVIRLFDMSAGLGIDLESHIEAKLRYNANRPKMHGKKY